MTQPTSARRAKGATAATRAPKSSANRPESGENRKAVEATLRELERMGRLEDVDAAFVQMLRSMADSLDAKPWNSQMWREYRETLERVIADGGNDEGIAALIADLRAPVRDKTQT